MKPEIQDKNSLETARSEILPSPILPTHTAHPVCQNYRSTFQKNSFNRSNSIFQPGLFQNIAREGTRNIVGSSKAYWFRTPEMSQFAGTVDDPLALERWIGGLSKYDNNSH